jgi:hypothetical protein
MKDLIERSAELDRRLDQAATIADLVRASRRMRWLILVGFTGLVLDIGLTAVVAYQEAQLQVANGAAARNANATYAACLADNHSRATQRQVWSDVLNLKGTVIGSDATPAQTAQRDQFKASLDQAFAPRTC